VKFLAEKFRSVLALFFRYRVGLSLLLIVGFLWENLNEHAVPRDIFNISDPRGFGGFVLVLGGIFLRSWAAGILRKGKELATTGPYALTRHPLYLGSFLIAAGFCLILGQDENIAAVTAFALVICGPKIMSEEKVLAEKFGAQWKEYQTRTGIMFPKKLPIGPFDWSFSQWARNKEYQALIVSLTALSILKLIRLKI